MQQRTRETFCKAYHSDRTQRNYKCRTHIRFARCMGYILSASPRYQTGFQVIFKIYGQVTSSRDEIGNFSSEMRKPWPFSSTFFTDIFSRIIFVCCGKDIHHVVMLIEISICARTQSQIISRKYATISSSIFSQFWSYLSVYLPYLLYSWHDFFKKKN